MRNRTPVPRDDRAALPEFAPVPRLKHRHDGWTPERQRAFIAALADTGSVTRAAGMVNMAQANCYTLRRAPGAESFRRAWDAALDCGVSRLKDIAFERAIEGQLVPVFVGGKLMGFRRKRNDALLMFCLRHYGQDAEGRRTTINYFSARATAGVAGADGPSTSTGASTATVRTRIVGGAGEGDRPALSRDTQAARRIEAFEGVTLDAEASAAIAAALEACAARRRADDTAIDAGGFASRDIQADDPDEPFVAAAPGGIDWRGELEPPVQLTDWVPFTDGEAPWALTGADLPDRPLPQEQAVPAIGEAGAGGRRKRKPRQAAGPTDSARNPDVPDRRPRHGGPPTRP